MFQDVSSLCGVWRHLLSVDASGSYLDQSDEAEEYTDCISIEVYDSPNDFPGYDTKQSDGEASLIMELWGMRSTPS